MWEKNQNTLETKYKHSFKEVLLDYSLTVGICTLIAVVITLLGLHENFLKNFVLSQSFGLCICTLILFTFGILKPQNRVLMVVLTVTAVLLGATLGLWLGVLILERGLHLPMNWPIGSMLRTLLVAVILSAGFLYFFISKATLKQRKEQIELEKSKRVVVEKEALEAKLRMLQAQIEPHFLFNTLSNVVSLIDTDPARGKAMLLDLTRYLRTSLSRTLPEATTLAQELDMISAYLSIQKIRMGDRLNFAVEASDDLRDKPFPPMLLQPLVENAVKHGLEPKIEGGDIFIRAREENAALKVEVIDTGLGIASFNANGVGMANVRERLGLLFGERGKFIIEEKIPAGVKVTIEVPVHD